MKLNAKETKALFSRVYDNKMEGTDHEDIKELVSRVFGRGELNPDPSLLHQFNNLVVQQADEVAKPMVTDMIGLLASTRSAARDEVVKYEIPRKIRAKVRWSANGSGVDLHRVENKTTEIAQPKTFTTGFYYEPFGMLSTPVESFQSLVNDIAQAKVRLYFDKIAEITQAAVASTHVPAKNVLVGDNLAIKDYANVASVLQRYGGRPVFVADSLLVDHFAMQQATDEKYGKLMSDNVREELLMELNPTRIARTDAVNLVNPFVDERNDSVELPVNVGYMFASSAAQKPFIVTEFGGMRQMTEQDIEDERVKMKIAQDADITLLFGEALGYIKDNSISL